MPIPKKYYEEMQAKRAEEHRRAERDTGRDLFRTGLMCVLWCVTGLVVFAFAFHTTDAGWAQVFKWGAYVITYGGVSYTLLRAYRQGEKRGDW